MATLIKMSPRLKISISVIERLLKLETNESTGCLYGLMYDGTLLVVGLSIELFENEKHAYNQLLLKFPAEIELCGVLKLQYEANSGSLVKEILQDVDITDNPLVIIINEKKEIKAHFLVHDKFEETKYDIVSTDNLWKEFLHVHLNTVLPLTCEATITGVKNMMQNKRKKIASGQVAFHIDNTSVYLFGVASDVGLTGTSVEATVGELLDSMNPEQPKKKKYANVVDILPVNFIMKATKDILSEKLVKTAVKMMTTQRKPSYCISIPLRIDTLAMIHRSTKLLDLYTVLVEAACRSLRLLESVLLEQLGQEGIGDGAGLRLPETFHYLPQELGHFLTRVVPKAIPDESMEKERRVLHEQLALPLTRPIFRRGNAYITDKVDGKLINPHEVIPLPPSKPDVTVAMVRGRYAYYHYNQDNFTDKGWGCAYRSMQTIFSWFRYQGYSTVPIPTHREIQQCLVNIGDKPASMLGSTQWIGSTEVMFCLESMLGVVSRIMFANNAAELQGFTPELVHHFEKQGTPVMIGGGDLAHTILGVEYDIEANDARYLILDPHYVGAEDLATVISKGWCGWKGSDFWKKTSRYNLCLPQTRPAL